MMQGRAAIVAVLAALLLWTAVPLAGAQSDSVLFLSTHLRPIEEAEKMRQSVLAGFPGNVEFVPVGSVPFFGQILPVHRTGRVTIGLFGGVHGDFPPLLPVRVLHS